MDELEAREDIVGIMAATLSRAWSGQFGRPIRVAPAGSGGEQLWRVQPLLNACFVQDVGVRARAFVRDSFRRTPVRSRRLAQYALGTALTTQVGLRLTSRPVFEVEPAVPDASELLVMPGNERIRVFDFRAGRTRVHAKEGFARDAFRTELAVRAGGSEGPFPRILAHGEDWFEEEIVDGWPLPRCPASVDRRRVEARVLELLQDWTGPSERTEHAALRAERLVARLRGYVAGLAERDPAWRALLAQIQQLEREAASLGEVPVRRTHGDLQPGNIMQCRGSDRILIIDWERSAERAAWYDGFVLGLRTRSTPGLAERLAAFAAGAGELGAAWPDPGRRRAALAMFVLEDLGWHVDASAAGPYRDPPHGLVAYREALAGLGVGGGEHGGAGA